MVDNSIQTFLQSDPTLPTSLLDISVKEIYLRGSFPLSTLPHLAVVGTRSCSQEGEKTTRMLIEPLARAGVVIVSGLAEGIDTAAHRAALDANGTTIAVLGTGIDNSSIYPRRNVALAEEIVDRGGAVISEYPIGTPGRKHHFPQRNRIVAALSSMTLVIEAPERSGALITAAHAIRLNRRVAVVPGALHAPQSKGCNALLEEGAYAITTPSRLAELLDVTLDTTKPSYTPQSSQERSILSLLEKGPQIVDTILDQCTLPIAQALGILSELEQKDVIEELGSKRYVLRAKLL